jgi:cobalt-zinc-cadmium efflux system outer membrane protein
MPMIRSRALCAVLAILPALNGCASYHPLPLPLHPTLATHLAGLDLSLPPSVARYPAQRIDARRPLTIDAIGLLAILNNPGLKSETGAIGVAQGRLLQATLLPNPSAGFSYGALLGGPGTTFSLAASLSQDIAALVVHKAQVKAALAGVYQVNADLLWREWQVAQKARQLAVDIYAADREIALARRELRLIAQVVAQIRTAITAGNLTLTALAPLLTAEAAAEEALAAQQLDRLKNWQALDALLGLVPEVRFAIARPVFAPLPRHLTGLIASLPERRPDLVALRFGYSAAEENVRAAILGQFPAFTLGVSGGKDTTAVVSAGPTFTFALPIFNRNQGRIAETRATRLLLREQYQARFDAALAAVRSLVAQLARLSADLTAARKAAASADALAAAARRAYAQSNLDQRSLTDYETTALERALQVVAFERLVDEDRIFLAVELGLDLPPTRIAPAARI